MSTQNSSEFSTVYPDSDTGSPEGIMREAIAAHTDYSYAEINPEGKVGDYVKDPATAQAVNEQVYQQMFGSKASIPGSGDDHFCYDNTLSEQFEKIEKIAESESDIEDLD